MRSAYRVAMAFFLPTFFLIFTGCNLLVCSTSFFFFWKHKNMRGTEFATRGENGFDRVSARRNCGAKLGRTETDAAQ